MRRLEPGESHEAAAQHSEVTDRQLDQKDDEGKAQANNAASSKDPLAGADPFQTTLLPSIADADEQQVLDPKTVLGCCRCARSFNQQQGLPTGPGQVGVDHARALEFAP